MEKYRLTIQRPGSLLPVVIDRDVDEQQLAAIQIVIDDEKTALNVIADKRIQALIAQQYPGWTPLMVRAFGDITESEERLLDGNR